MTEESNDLIRSNEFTPTFVVESDQSKRKVSGPTRKSSKGGWTHDEDKILMNAVERYNGKNWKKIAECLPRINNRNDIQCQHRWLKVLNPNLNKGSWSQEEDDILREMVSKENDGKPKWSQISKQLHGRIGKQCRERWHNYLNPTIIRTPWTKEEETILVHAQSGLNINKWSEFAKLLPGRSENNIKNHWNCSLKKRLDQFGSESSHAIQSNITILPFQSKEVAPRRLKRDPLELTLYTTSLVSEEEEAMSSSSIESISTSHYHDHDMTTTCLTTPSKVIKEFHEETSQMRKDNSVKEIRERLRMAGSTFKNTPSIISKRSSPLKLQEVEFQTSPSSSVNALSKPLERRLEFEFI
ncbi:unnamed protein product [Cochlearia groenlandica]